MGVVVGDKGVWWWGMKEEERVEERLESGREVGEWKKWKQKD